MTTFVNGSGSQAAVPKFWLSRAERSTMRTWKRKSIGWVSYQRSTQTARFTVSGPLNSFTGFQNDCVVFRLCLEQSCLTRNIEMSVGDIIFPTDSFPRSHETGRVSSAINNYKPCLSCFVHTDGQMGGISQNLPLTVWLGCLKVHARSGFQYGELGQVGATMRRILPQVTGIQ